MLGLVPAVLPSETSHAIGWRSQARVCAAGREPSEGPCLSDRLSFLLEVCLGEGRLPIFLAQLSSRRDGSRANS